MKKEITRFKIDKDIVNNEVKVVNAKIANLAGAGLATEESINNANKWIRRGHFYFQDADIEYTDLDNINITFINFNGAKALGANFKNSILKGATMRGADLRGANFDNADLRDVDFTGANLSGVSFVNADLKGAIVVGITYDELTFTKSLNKPILPDNKTYKVEVFNLNEQGYQ